MDTVAPGERLQQVVLDLREPKRDRLGEPDRRISGVVVYVHLPSMVGPKSGVYRAFRYSPCVRICALKTILAQKKHMSSLSEETRAERANIIRDALKELKKKGTSVREIVRITHSTNSVIRGILAGKTPNPNSMIPLEKWAVEKGLLKEGSPPPEPVDLRSAREIGEIIAAIRKRRGMNQEAFAAAIGRGDQGQVSRWENGHEVPGDAILQAIANFAGENVRIFHKPRPARSVHELWPDNLSVRSTLEGGAVREERAGYGATSTIDEWGLARARAIETLAELLKEDRPLLEMRAQATVLAGRAALLEAEKAPDRSKDANVDADYLARMIEKALRARRASESRDAEQRRAAQDETGHDPTGGAR